MAYDRLPSTAAWRHQRAREGFEVLFVEPRGDGWRFHGHTAAIEDGEAWSVTYRLDIDDRWRTRAARISGRSAPGERIREIETDGEGHWSADGVARPALDGCLDLDLESSAFTNALPVHRLRLSPGAEAQARAAYVRALDLGLERLEQSYRRLADDGPGERYDYVSPSFDFGCELVYDAAGLVLHYPGIAIRVG
jgi:uncharacterized protein